jgi:hypothetical protein
MMQQKIAAEAASVFPIASRGKLSRRSPERRNIRHHSPVIAVVVEESGREIRPKLLTGNGRKKSGTDGCLGWDFPRHTIVTFPDRVTPVKVDDRWICDHANGSHLHPRILATMLRSGRRGTTRPAGPDPHMHRMRRSDRQQS